MLEGKPLKRGDTLVTAKHRIGDNEAGKSLEDEQIWIVTSIAGDMVRAKCFDAPEWRQAFFIDHMRRVELIK